MFQTFTRRTFLQLSALGVSSVSAGCTLFSQAATTDEKNQPPQGTPGAPTEGVAVPPSSTGNRLRIGLSSHPDSLDPARYTLVDAFTYGFAVFDLLVWINVDLTIEPMLAERWEASEDGLQWTFYLRKGVTFHHGSPFSSKDVVYTFQRILDPALASLLHSVLSFIEQVEAIDELTVRFHLRTPNLELPILLGSPQASIVSHQLDTSQLATTPSGTGPFRVVKFDPELHMLLARNPKYWDQGTLYIDEIEHRYLRNFSQQVAALRAGELDLLLDMARDEVEALQADENIQILETPSGRYHTLAMRVNDLPFSDLRVRQAVKCCIDTQVLRQRVLDGHGEVGYHQPVASVSPYWVQPPDSPVDLTKARELLTAAGYAAGFTMELVTADVAPGMIDLAYAIQEMVRPVGINLNVIEVKVSAEIYLAEYWGRAPLYISLSDFRPSIYETFTAIYHSRGEWNAETGWSSEQLDQWLDAAANENNEEKRKELYAKAQTLVREEGAAIISYFLPTVLAARKTVQGLTPHPAGWLDMRGVKIGQ